MPKLPSLTAVRAFEAVARTGSIRAAARELNVVHGAVGQQIRSLEVTLGRPLFRRVGRGLELTPQGENYARAIRSAFDIIERATLDLSTAHGAQPFRLGMREAFAAYWFMPRYRRFLEAGIALDLEIIEMPRTAMNVYGTGLDGLIVGGDYVPHHESTSYHFMDGKFGPVAASALFAGKTMPQPIEILQDMRAIWNVANDHLWPEWLYETGYPAVEFGGTLVLASMSLVVEALREGLGVGLMPLPHIANDLKSGRLVAPFGMHTRQGGYLLSCSRQWAGRREVEQLVEWLRAEGLETNAVC